MELQVSKGVPIGSDPPPQSTDLLRSFRGQHCEKMVCMRERPGVTGPLGPNGVGDYTTTLRRLLNGAERVLSMP